MQFHRVATASRSDTDGDFARLHAKGLDRFGLSVPFEYDKCRSGQVPLISCEH